MKLFASFSALLLLVAGAVFGASDDDVTPAPHRKHHTASASPTPHAKTSPVEVETDSPAAKARLKKSLVDDLGPSSSSKRGTGPSRRRHVIPIPTPEDDETPAPKKHTTSTHRKRVTPQPEETPAPAATPASTPDKETPPSAIPTPTPHSAAENATLDPEQLVEFSKQPERVQGIIVSSLALTKQNLSYIYGSADPAQGGLDCSGFIYHVLHENGLTEVPRDASGQYVWVRKADKFEAVLSKNKDTFELRQLQPGDLLFWTGTYSTEKDPPVTHTMIYLGTEKGTGRRVMVGSSDGRTYDGKSRWGVSVFDFKITTKSPGPESKNSPMFVGYGAIPGLRE